MLRTVWNLISVLAVRLAIVAVLVVVAVLLVDDLRRGIFPRSRSPSTSGGGLIGPDVQSAGWPHLRGPRLDGTSAETSLADRWPADGPARMWIASVGEAYSAAVVVGGRVFTQQQTLYRQSVICLEGDSGALLWEHAYGWPYQSGGMYPGPRSTPTVADGRVYFADPRGLVGCLDARDGRRIWLVDLHQRHGLEGHDFGYSCSPLVIDGMVVMPVGGTGTAVVALDVRDGSTLWAGGDRPASYASAIPWEVDGQAMMVVAGKNALCGHDQRTGRVLWEHVLSRGYDEHAACPIPRGRTIFMSSAFRRGAIWLEVSPPAVDASSEADEPTWSVRRARECRKMSNDVASSVLVDGTLFGFDLRNIQTRATRPSDGMFRAIDFDSGEILWSTDRTGQASLIAADGKLLLTNDSGEALLVAASREGYEELGRVDVFGGEICWTAGALDRGRLYLRSPTRVACLWVGEGEPPVRIDERPVQPSRDDSPLSRMGWGDLIRGEREYPADVPETRELIDWLGDMVLWVLAAAIAAGLVVQWVLSLRGVAWAGSAGRVVFWTMLVVWGVLATPTLNRVLDRFAFTWPIALFAVHQIALSRIIATSARSERGARWRSGGWGVVLLAAAMIYFHACRETDLAMLWVFLIGFAPSWPVAVPAAYRTAGGKTPLWREMAWTVGGFLLYYAACATYFAWIRP